MLRKSTLSATPAGFSDDTQARRSAPRPRGRVPAHDAVYCARFLRALGHIVRRRRVMAGLSLDAFAALAGVTRGQLAKIESGYQAPGAKAFAAICGLLDIPPVKLFLQSMHEVETQMTLQAHPSPLTPERTPPTAAHRPTLPSHS